MEWLGASAPVTDDRARAHQRVVMRIKSTLQFMSLLSLAEDISYHGERCQHFRYMLRGSNFIRLV